MKGDFSRNTFDPQHRFARVLMQQGRVMLDADWNEQTSILLHYLRKLTQDLIGPHGGPGDGFKIRYNEDLRCDFIIERGHYYVEGILCENLPPVTCSADVEPPLFYSKQVDCPEAEPLEKGASYFVYLDVWERHLSHLQAEHIREVALGGPDTASRAKIVWQVKVHELDKESEGPFDRSTCDGLLEKVERPRPLPCLKARARVGKPSDDPCILPPEARYRGAENQLYRVEIHDGGEAKEDGEDRKDGATFKWSRDNGSVEFAIRTLQGNTATLESLGPDDKRGLQEGQWVEIVDDHSVLHGVPRPLAKVESIDRASFEVTLAIPDGASAPSFREDSTTHPLLRRWDQDADAIAVVEGSWIDLEDGVQVCFEPGGTYRTGDYWLVPSRTATGDVLWPSEVGPDGKASPQALPPDGIEHHYAPLACISLDNDGVVTCDSDCRMSYLPHFFDVGGDQEKYVIEDGPTLVDEQIAILMEITGVGEARAKLLLEAECETLAKVAAFGVDGLVEVLGVNKDVAEKIRVSAAEKAAGAP